MPSPDSPGMTDPRPSTAHFGELGLPPPTPEAVSVMIEAGRYIFQTSEGDPLFTHERDPPGESTCYDACAKDWTPLLVEGGGIRTVGDWSVIVRQDDSHQWAYKDKPVYVPTKDSARLPREHWRLLSP